MMFNSYLASADFCHLLITFANSLEPDQDWHYDPKWFDTLIVFLKDCFEKVNFEKSLQVTTIESTRLQVGHIHLCRLMGVTKAGKND